MDLHRSPEAAERMRELLAEGMSLAGVEDAMGETDCPDGCYVEPDGYCSHGYESAGLTAQVI